jgi:hypothetical protein
MLQSPQVQRKRFHRETEGLEGMKYLVVKFSFHLELSNEWLLFSVRVYRAVQPLGLGGGAAFAKPHKL